MTRRKLNESRTWSSRLTFRAETNEDLYAHVNPDAGGAHSPG